MKRLLALLLTLAVVGFVYAQTITDVELVEFGTFRKTRSNGLMSAPNAIAEMEHAVVDAKLIKETTTIPASIGTSFGVRIKVTGDPDGAVVKFTGRCTHPKLSDPVSGRSSTTEEWDCYPVIGRTGYIGYTFDNSWELVPGKWILQVFYGAKLVAKKEFDVTSPEHASNQALERTAARRVFTFSND
jgi:Domain of unknown function (DUF3859)